MEISVIMPVCNAERTLRRAIDSALLQATSLEVLCVDDGSTDNSADILREYALREPRVRAIFTRRRGPGAANGRAGITSPFSMQTTTTHRAHSQR